jgi:DNA-binding response OmpR family regulator
VENAQCSADLRGARILIVEDEVLLAMDLEDRLRREGCDVIGMAPREAKALEILERGRPEAVVLDLNLDGKLPAKLAETLVARQIPFVIVTGYGNRRFDLPALQDAPRLNKPVNTQDLIRVLSGLVRGAD